MLGLKIAAALVGLALLAGGVHWCASTIEKAGERDAALAQVAQVEKEKAELAHTFAKAQERDIAIAAELAALRAQREADHKAFTDFVSSRPLTKEVPIVVNGQTTTIRVRDAHRYRCLHNLAVTGKADSDCVF